jgi:hypothetical protein
MQTHLPVGADFGKRAAFTDIAMFDDPNFAGWRFEVGGRFLGN